MAHNSTKKRKRKGVMDTKAKKKAFKKLKRNTTEGCAIGNAHVRADWNRKQKADTNFAKMGIAMDPNKVLTVPKPYNIEILDVLNLNDGNDGTKHPRKPVEKSLNTIDKIAETVQVQNDRNYEMFKSKKGSCKIGGDDILLVKMFLDKYDKDDYKGMARDPRNHYQLTPKEIKGKVRSFCEDPLVFVPYCREKGLLPGSTPNPSVTPETQEAMSVDLQEKP